MSRPHKRILGPVDLTRNRFCWLIWEVRKGGGVHCLSPICDFDEANEDNENFLLHCPRYDVLRQDLVGHFDGIDFVVSDMDSKSLCNLLLFGGTDVDVNVNKLIKEETFSFVDKTKRI